MGVCLYFTIFFGQKDIPMVFSSYIKNDFSGNGCYTHNTRGRLRHDVAGLKNSTKFVRDVEFEFLQKEGILHVEANAVTGRILLLFEPERVTHDELILPKY